VVKSLEIMVEPIPPSWLGAGGIGVSPAPSVPDDPSGVGKARRDIQVRQWKTTIPRRSAQALSAFFQECVESGRGLGPPPVSNEDGLRFLEIQHALYRATETGETQRLRPL